MKQLLHDAVASLTRKIKNEILSHAVLNRKIKGQRLLQPLDQKHFKWYYVSYAVLDRKRKGQGLHQPSDRRMESNNNSYLLQMLKLSQTITIDHFRKCLHSDHKFMKVAKRSHVNIEKNQRR